MDPPSWPLPSGDPTLSESAPDHPTTATSPSRRTNPGSPVESAGCVPIAISVGTQTAIVVELLLGGLRRRAVQRVAALFAHQHPLQQTRLDCPARRVMLVPLQLLLRQCERRLAHQRGHRDLDPVLMWAFMIRAVSSCMYLTLT